MSINNTDYVYCKAEFFTCLFLEELAVPAGTFTIRVLVVPIAAESFVYLQRCSVTWLHATMHLM